MALDPVTAAIEAGHSLIKRIFPDKDAAGRRDLEALLAQVRTAHEAKMAQIEVNKVEAAHRNLYVAGWRPFVGWTCGVALAYGSLFYPLLQGVGGIELPPPTFIDEHTMPILYALLGLGGVRTIEKLRGVAR